MRLAVTTTTVYVAIALCVAGCATTKSADPTIAAAESGDSLALNQLCYGYLYGESGYQQDFKQALIWCKKGAETGDPNDETLFAEMYHMGEGVGKDDAIARIWYKRAAEQNHVHAQLMMAILSYRNKKPDGSIDGVEICYWLKRAIAQHYDKAQQFYDHLSAVSYPTNPADKSFCDDPLLNTTVEPP